MAVPLFTRETDRSDPLEYLNRDVDGRLLPGSEMLPNSIAVGSVASSQASEKAAVLRAESGQ